MTCALSVEKFRVYIGWDPREYIAWSVAQSSLLRHTKEKIDVHALRLNRLRKNGLYFRPTGTRQDGVMWDLLSDAPCSTEFAISRFVVPLIQHEGWALFTDCDVVFLADVMELLALADPTKAVQVVKHLHRGHEQNKMDNQPQTAYARKNWSSVVLWNCAHEAHERLNLGAINTLPGRALHQFCWLRDEEIGDLPQEWNWLVGVQPKPEKPKIAHFTLGGPFLYGWPTKEHDEIWIEAYKGIL